MTEPDWAKVLEVLYREHGEMYREIKGELSEEHNLVNKTSLDPDVVEDTLVFLREQGLIEQSGAGHERSEACELQSTHIKYTLTTKGFEVAHERELRQRQQELVERQNDITEQMAGLTEDQTESSRIIATFTVILAATALIDALTSIVSTSEYSSFLSLIYALLLVSLWYKRDEWLLTTE